MQTDSILDLSVRDEQIGGGAVSKIAALRSWVRSLTREERYVWAEDVVTKGIAQQIVDMRVARGWTQGELARRIGIAQSVVSKYESGEYGNWSVRTLLNIARAFDCAFVARFVGWDEFIVLTADGAFPVPKSFVEDEMPTFK